MGFSIDLLNNHPAEFEMDYPTELPVVLIDQVRIRQMLNLLNNARRYTSQGTIHISVEHNEQQIVFYVADTGIGIAQSDLERIFDAYYQVDYKLSRGLGGAGLGLAICKNLSKRTAVSSGPTVNSVRVLHFHLPYPSPISPQPPPYPLPRYHKSSVVDPV